MKRRVGGLETEYGLVCVRADGSRALEPEAAARELFRPVVAMGRSSNVFLRNAARLYLDVGSHPEYASAECDDWWELVAQDRAGDRIFADLATQANQRFAADGQDARIHLLKNNVDSAGNAFGSHENFLVDRRGEFTRLPKYLLPFLVTRQIITGAGGAVRPAGKDGEDAPAQFVFSRRSDHMWEAVSSATTRTRPIINTRDEPHGDPTRFRRLHVIVGDSTMSEVSTYLRFATTDLVLRAIESGRALPELSLHDDISAIRAVARDLTGTTPLPLAAWRHHHRARGPAAVAGPRHRIRRRVRAVGAGDLAAGDRRGPHRRPLLGRGEPGLGDQGAAVHPDRRAPRRSPR